MIDKLKRRIFWIVELLPLTVLFFVLVAYNFSYSTYMLSDETATLDYCAKCVSKYSNKVDKYLYLPVEDLIEARNTQSEGNKNVNNLLYSIIASDICVIKISNEGELLAEIGDYSKDSRMSEIVSKLKSTSEINGKENDMLYKIVSKPDCRYIILLNTVRWHAEIRKYIVISCMGLLLAALLLALVARYISRKITQPVEEALEKQNRFIADASHELKTPVSVINANISVLEREYGTNKWMDYIKEEGHKMTLLVSDLLNLCRLDYEAHNSNVQKLQTTTFCLSEAIMEAALPFDSIAFEKNASISIECNEDYICQGSPSDFKKILAILLDNAIGHCDSFGQITIATSSGRKNSVYVQVTNTGSEIREEDLPHIFDRFYKARNTEAHHNNFGLGLSIAKALAEKNGFELKAHSSHKATTMQITLTQ